MTHIHQYLRNIWRDECGAVLSAELIMLVTLLAVGLIVGSKSFRDSVVTEWADYAQAIANLDQSYHIPNTFTLDPPPGKVVICHRTGSSSNPFVTLVVSVNALQAHLNHGDTLGPCPGDPGPPEIWRNNNDGALFVDRRDFCDDLATNNPNQNSNDPNNGGTTTLPGPFIVFPDANPE